MVNKMTSNKKEDRFFKEPNKIIQNLGKLPISMTLKCPKNFTATCVALESVAKAENRDNIVRKDGNDDYSMSLEKLFNAFDTFIREHSKKTNSTGWIENYDFSNSCELTIFLLWQIRHTWTHNGGLIDKKCKNNYEKTLNSAFRNGVMPIIDLPENLEVGHEFTIQFEDYYSTKKCVFKYIGNRLSKEDLNILYLRSSITNIKFNKCEAVFNYGFGTLAFNLEEAYNCGCEINTVKGEFKAPSEMEYNFETERVILISTGQSFSARLVKRLEQANNGLVDGSYKI